MQLSPLGIRSTRERVIQTLWFEAVGLAIVAPLFSALAGSSMGESFAMIVVVSVIVTVWAALFNTVFDRIEYRFAHRPASDRPHGLRMLHAVSLEASAVIVTWPVIVAMTDLGWLQALVADIALTITYAAYGYVFHIVFDRLRPVRPAPPVG